MRGIIEKPGKKVRRGVEKGGESGAESEIGDAGANVATEKKEKTKQSKSGVKIARFGNMPAPTNDEIRNKRGDIKSADDIHIWHDLEEKVGKNQDKGERAEDNDRSFELFAVQADGMDDLGDEKTNDADFGSIIDGEDDVGEKSDKEGELK